MPCAKIFTVYGMSQNIYIFTVYGMSQNIYIFTVYGMSNFLQHIYSVWLVPKYLQYMSCTKNSYSVRCLVPYQK